MHIIFDRNILNKSLNILQKAAQNKVSSNLPGAIYIKTYDNYAELQANDYELGIKINIDAEILESGTVVLASKFFHEIVRKMPNDTIELKSIDNSNSIMLISGTAEYKMIVYNEDNFTLVEKITSENTINIDTKDFKELIDLTSYAVTNDENRIIFTGLLLEINKNEISMVGTDTHRLATKRFNLEQKSPYEMYAIIPSKILNEISKLLPIEQPQMLKIIWNKTQIAFLFDNVYMIVRLIDGRFPDYKKIIPSQFDTNVILNRRELIAALDRVSLFGRDSNYTAVKFDWHENNVILTSQNIDIGTAKEELPCELKGKEFSISFNCKYILDILRRGTDELVNFNMIDRGPIVIRLDEQPNYIYVATPIRAN